MAAEDEGREKALRFYKILACLFGLLGVALLVCGILAVTSYDSDSFGMPYFLGGFIVGILTLISAAVCTCIFLKAPDANSDVKKRELACAVQGQYILSMFTIMGCFIGCVSAGVGGLSSSGFRDEEDEDENKKTLAIVILLGCIGAIFLTIFSMCVVCTYSSYFGVVIQRGRRGRMVFMNTGGNTTMPATIHTTTFQTNIPQTQGDQVSQLEAQNRLLQQQLELQRQLFQQQQQQQQQQTQYSGGFYPPPPPPSYGFSDTGPSAPPPSYNDVK